MGSISNLLKKDINHFRYILVGWIILIVIQFFLNFYGYMLIIEHLELQIILPVINQIINFFQKVMILVLITLVVQDDSTAGTTAFWLTRPISRKKLLLSKVCFISLFVILIPLLSEIFLMTLNKLNIAQIFIAIPEILLKSTAFCLCVFILASLTHNFSNFAIVGISIAGVLIIGSILNTLFSIFFSPHDIGVDPETYRSYSLSLSVETLRNLLTIILGSSLMLHQYVTRQSRKTVFFLFVGCLVIILVTTSWTWDFLKNEVISYDTKSDKTSIDIDDNYIMIADSIYFQKESIVEKIVSTKIVSQNLLPTQFILVKQLENIRIQYPDGEVLESLNIINEDQGSIQDERFLTPIKNLFRDYKVVNSYYRHFTYQDILRIQEGDYKENVNEQGVYFADISFDIYEYIIDLSLTVAPGQLASSDTAKVVIHDVVRRDKGISIILDEMQTNLLFDRGNEKIYPYKKILRSEFIKTYVLKNSKRKEVFIPEVEDVDYMHADVNVFGQQPRFSHQIKKYNFLHINDRSGPLPKIDDEWLRDAELICIKAVKIGNKKVPIQKEDFLLPEKSTDEIVNP